MNHVFKFEATTYFLPNIVIEILDEIASLLDVDTWLLQSPTAIEGRVRDVAFDERGVSSAYLENYRTHGAHSSELMGFVSKDGAISGSFVARQYLSDGWLSDARKYDLALNQLNFEITSDQPIDNSLTKIYQSVVSRVSRHVVLAHAWVRSFTCKYKSRKVGALGIVSALPGIYWINYFGASLVKGLELNRLAPEFSLTFIDGGCIAAYNGSESDFCDRELEFVNRLGSDNFWALSESKSGQISVFRFLAEGLTSSLSAKFEPVRFEIDVSKMTAKNKKT
jgi:hypothetical protein